MSYYPIYTYDGKPIVMNTSEFQPQSLNYNYVQSQLCLPNYNYVQSQQYYSGYTYDDLPIVMNTSEY